jgi:hypothetical protein
MYDRQVRARLVDFFALEGLQWPRRLWDVGSLLALEELLEAGSWARHRVLSAATVDWQRHQLLRVVGPDVGLGDRDLRAELTSLLNRPLPDPSPSHRRLREVVDHARGGYLDRWAVAAALPVEQRPQPEWLARIVAAHLLDLGYDASHLAAWIRQLTRGRASAEGLRALPACDHGIRTLSRIRALGRRTQAALPPVLTRGDLTLDAARRVATRARTRPHQAWRMVVPAWAMAGGVGATLVIGGLAGLYPARRAARMAPTEALLAP